MAAHAHRSSATRPIGTPHRRAPLLQILRSNRRSEEFMDLPANGSGIGQPVRRREDLRLVRGGGRYAADENLPGQAYAVMLRSPHAHARIRSIAKDAALKIPGVLAVLTGADFVADGLHPIPHKVWSQHPAEIQLNPPEVFTAPHYPLPTDKARFAGEAVAMVVAETVNAAKNGVDAGLGNAAATAAGFARAAHITRFDTWVRRVTGAPMEPRAALAAFDPATGRYTLYAGNGGAVRLKDDLATILGVTSDKVHVLMGDVGGNFGTRG